jgi:two-component system cell cycle response regulator
MPKHAQIPVPLTEQDFARATAHPLDSSAHGGSWNPDDTTRIFLPNLAQALPQRVLVVDDDPLMRERLEALVLAAGFEVTCAASGREALDALRRDYCPIVISDWAMPDMNGIELCRAIRAESFPGYVYFLLLTARDSHQDIVAGLDAGADDYLSKRVTEEELVARLRTAKRIVGLEQSLRDMIDEKRRLATTDALTGANNRHYFDKHVSRELKRVRRFGGPLSILLLDIDHFKAVNDRHGHSVGDDVLVEFAGRIAAALPRDFDWCARVGGEEFVVVLPQTDLPGAIVVAEKLRQYVANAPIKTGAGNLAITVSIGVAALCCMPPGEAPAVDDLLDLADKALYRSKQLGRNRVTAAQSVSSS